MGSFPQDTGMTNCLCDFSRYRTKAETYIGEQVMEDAQFVIRTKDFLLDPNTVEVRLHESYVGSICKKSSTERKHTKEKIVHRVDDNLLN